MPKLVGFAVAGDASGNNVRRRQYVAMDVGRLQLSHASFGDYDSQGPA